MALLRQSYVELKALRIKGFCEVVDNEESFEKGLASMISLSGLGKMKPILSFSVTSQIGNPAMKECLTTISTQFSIIENNKLN